MIQVYNKDGTLVTFTLLVLHLDNNLLPLSMSRNSYLFTIRFLGLSTRAVWHMMKTVDRLPSTSKQYNLESDIEIHP